MKQKHTDHRVALSTREERGARDALDISKPGDMPMIGRDIPAVEGKDGYPVAQWTTRVQSYGQDGFYHETQCQSCMRWLSYKLCAPCASMLRMFGHFDRQCQCRRESLHIYVNCDDHKLWEL